MFECALQQRSNPNRRLPPAHRLLFLHRPCKSVPIRGHVLVKPEPNEYTVPPRTIYSGPTELQSKHRLPRNSVPRNLCCNFICIPKYDRWMLQEYIYRHTCTLPHAWIHIATRLTLLKWFWVLFSAWLNMQNKNSGPCLKKKKKTMSPSNIWHQFRVPRNIASSITGAVTQRD